MAADIVNLRHARKQKAREVKSDTASENRARFGRSKTEKQRDSAEANLASRRLDQLKRGDETEP